MEKIIYKKSFAAKLVLAGKETIDVYQTINDVCLTHLNIKTRLAFEHLTISAGRKKIGMVKLARKNLTLYLALDPNKYLNTSYNISDVSDILAYKNCPLMIKLTNAKNIKQAIKLLEAAFVKYNATEVCEAEDIDYGSIFYERSFDELLNQGLIKKYVRLVEFENEDSDSFGEVEFNAKLLYEATNQAQDLYIVTNYDNWDLTKAIKMNKVAENSFTAIAKYPLGTNLEFKICRSNNWSDVEKGIWKEEIVNHNYTVMDEYLNVEDLIHNFCIDINK